MQLDTWLLFFLTSIGLSLTPGPNGLLALAHGAMHGRKNALFTIAGSVLGFVVIIALCMFGIGALVKSSIVWLTILKWLGAAYLIWLGIKLWRSPPITLAKDLSANPVSVRVLFRQGLLSAVTNPKGLLSAVTNPKGLLFFSALLPQFLDPHRSLIMQFAVVAATYATTEFVVEYLFANAADHIRPWLVRAGRKFNRVCGVMFMAIGSALPLR